MTPSRVVIRAPNWLGDIVLALPAMAAVRRQFADATLAVAAPAAFMALFAESTDARPDELLSVHTARGRREEVQALAAGRFDLAILLPNSFTSAWVARAAGIPERWGYRSDLRGWLLTRRVGKPSGRVHQMEYYRRLVAGLGAEAGDALPRIAVSEATRARGRDRLSRRGGETSDVLVGLAPGASGGHAKRWPSERMGQLVERLATECQARCVLVGAPGDRDAGREIESWLVARGAGNGVVNMIGATDLGTLLGVLAECRVFVSNDSGAMHLAAALGLPVTAIFGPTDERVTAPVGGHAVLSHQVFCRPCMLRECPIDHRCMKGVSVGAVFEAVSRHLGRQRPETAI